MSWQLDVALKAHCVSLGSQSLASFTQPTRAKLQQNGRERCSWAKQIHSLAMCFLMDSQLCCHAVCAEFQQVGTVIWHFFTLQVLLMAISCGIWSKSASNNEKTNPTERSIGCATWTH